MPLSSIVLIVVRLFALNWLLQALVLIASAVAVPLSHSHYMSAILMHYGPAIFLTILAILLWILAPAVARFASGGFDASVNMGGLSRSDLYSFAFIFLGLFFILSSFADVINWIHYFAVAPEDLRHDPRIQNFYKLTRPCLTLAAGVISLLGAPRWTRKLISHHRRSDLT